MIIFLEQPEQGIRVMTERHPLKSHRWPLIILLALYLVLSLAFGFVNPPFEAPDEWYHYRFVRDLIETRQLPVQSLDAPKSEAHQPPLYYTLGALLTFWVDDSAPPPELNPYWGYHAERVGADNKRLYLHTGAETIPCRDRCLAVRLLRLFSMFLGVSTIYAVWQTLSEFLPDSPACVFGGTALVALNPMFLYQSGTINNDHLVVMWGAFALWLSLRVVRRGIDIRTSLLAGLVVGLAPLAKVSGLLLIPLLGLAYGLAAWLRREWKPALWGMTLIVVIAALLSGWWFIRNLALYGEPTGVQLMLKIWGQRPPGENILHVVGEFPYLWTTFWGRFGYGQIPLSNFIYNGLGLFAALAAMGLVKLVIHPPLWFDRETRLCMVVLVVAIGLFLIATLNYMWICPMAAMGRFLFPALSALGGLLFLGLAQHFSQRRVPLLAGGVTVFMAGLAVVAVANYVAPAYARPSLLTLEEIATRAHSTDVRFGDGIRLAGYELERQRVHPGEEVAVTLCWEAVAPLSQDYAFFVHFLGPRESIIGARDTYPGLGRFPTSQWTPGDAFCDTVRVPVEEWAAAPAVYGVEIGWYEPETGERLPAYSADGTPTELVLVERIKVVPDEYPVIEAPNRVDADLGGQIALLGYDVSGQRIAPGQAITITLYWLAQAPVPADYTVFVHLTDSAGAPYAQDDSQPQHDAYPTFFWDVGETVIDPHVILLPSDMPLGEYSLLVGMYLLETGERLPAFDEQGTRFPADAIPLGAVEVQR